MKRKSTMHIAICIYVLLCAVGFAHAEEKSPWDFSIVVDFAYYPKSDFIVGNGDDHFSAVSGVYSGVEARVTGAAGYTIPVPFSDNPLVSGNRVHVYGKFELSPVSMMPAFGVSFSPIAFLDFNAGASIAAGWNFDLLGIQGIAVWNHADQEYKSLVFESALVQAWFQGTFMFDLAALMPGDWNHVVTMNTFKVHYSGLTHGGEDGNPWLYHGSGEQANGLKYYASFLLGYQMPLALQTVALQAELEGHFDGRNDYDEIYHGMRPDFMTIHISPVAILKFTEKDELTLQFRFSSRQSFTEEYDTGADRFVLTYAGRQWYFNRIALSYKHNF